ncbi:hypothetical protein [Paenibacillus sp. HJGM_3]|uniref:hypothetical protein n=1 Tax=Paenibacillus sp. HJGM_3 TaxID=3379816 RepID=UPI00386AB351
MQTKIRIAIAHKQYSGSYINRGASGLTTDLDAAITFKDIGEASEWLLNAYYAPVDKECYKYARIEVTKRELEDEDNANS